MSPQAKRLSDAMRALGVPRRAYAVRTMTYIRGGVRYYGDGYLVCYRREATDAVIANAGELRRQGFRVDVFGPEDARSVSVGS